MYFYGFILCEFLNVLVATSVLFLTNKFLNHSFLLYGLKVGKLTISRAPVKLFLPPRSPCTTDYLRRNRAFRKIPCARSSLGSVGRIGVMDSVD